MQLYKLFIPVVFLTSIVIFSSCKENSIEVINTIANDKKMPTIAGDNVEITYSDSARVESKIVAKVIDSYATAQKPYIEFPKGMSMYFYDRHQNVIAQIKANYAIFYQDKKVWEARNNVVAINTKGEKLNTEQLFWDEQKKIIYSHKYTRITNQDGTFTGQGGFEANEDFTKWTLIGTKGTVKQ